MTEEPALVALADVLDLTAAKPLADELAALRGRPVRLDATNVERLGALCLQVLLSARLTWASDGLPLTLAQASSAFAEQIQALGSAEFASAGSAGFE
jgi:chemotaxis protein CheX